MSRWYNEAAVVERGPLVYALRMNEKWERHAMEPEKQTLLRSVLLRGDLGFPVELLPPESECSAREGRGELRGGGCGRNGVLSLDARRLSGEDPYPGPPHRRLDAARRVGGADRLRLLAADVHDARSGVDRTEFLTAVRPCVLRSSRCDRRTLAVYETPPDRSAAFFGTADIARTVRRTARQSVRPIASRTRSASCRPRSVAEPRTTVKSTRRVASRYRLSVMAFCQKSCSNTS